MIMKISKDLGLFHKIDFWRKKQYIKHNIFQYFSLRRATEKNKILLKKFFLQSKRFNGFGDILIIEEVTILSKNKIFGKFEELLLSMDVSEIYGFLEKYIYMYL